MQSFSPGVAFAIGEALADIQLNPCSFSYVEQQLRVRNRWEILLDWP